MGTELNSILLFPAGKRIINLSFNIINFFFPFPFPFLFLLQKGWVKTYLNKEKFSSNFISNFTSTQCTYKFIFYKNIDTQESLYIFSTFFVWILEFFLTFVNIVVFFSCYYFIFSFIEDITKETLICLSKSCHSLTMFLNFFLPKPDVLIWLFLYKKCERYSSA